MESPVKRVLLANTAVLWRKENIRIEADRQKKLFYSVLPHELPGELAVPPEARAQAAAIPNPAVTRRKNSCSCDPQEEQLPLIRRINGS